MATWFQISSNLWSVEAARMLAAVFGIKADESAPVGPPSKPKPGKHQKGIAAEALFMKLWSGWCDLKWKAQAFLKCAHTKGATYWENPIFIAALRVRSLAEERLDALAGYDLNDKLALLSEGGAPGDES